MSIASKLDHSLLKPTATIADIELLCNEAKEYGFRAVCIPPLFIKTARKILEGTTIKVAAVTGFPFGYSAIEAKLAETVLALVDNVDEVEMVMNIAAVKNADWQYLAKEITTIMPIVRAKEKTLKVILETGLLTNPEIITCCDIYGAAGIDWIKTSTGFQENGANVDTIKLLRSHLATVIRINASGPVTSYDLAMQLLNAGSDCIGTDNAIQIVKEEAILN